MTPGKLGGAVQAAIEGLNAKSSNLLISPAIQEKLINAITKAVSDVIGDYMADMQEILGFQAIAIDDLEQYGRRNPLRIHGIPETEGDEKEDTDKLVI